MGKKLYVSGLAWATTDEGLQQAFAPIGEIVSARVIRDRETGRSRGFGFVEYASEEDAATAIDQLHETDLDGRRIRVDIAQERPPRGGGPEGGHRGGPRGGHRGGGGGWRGGRGDDDSGSDRPRGGRRPHRSGVGDHGGPPGGDPSFGEPRDKGRGARRRRRRDKRDGGW